MLMPKDNNIRTFNYRIDAMDKLEFVDPAWLGFATDNDASNLTVEQVYGTSIWDYIAGYEVKYLYEMLFDAVRTRRRGVTIPFRCDSPTRRRFMELRIEPLDANALSLTGTMFYEESRPYSSLFDNKVKDADSYLRICSWCKRVDVGDDVWLEVEDAVRELDLFDDASPPGLDHSICLDCLAHVHNKLEAV